MTNKATCLLLIAGLLKNPNNVSVSVYTTLGQPIQVALSWHPSRLESLSTGLVILHNMAEASRPLMAPALALGTNAANLCQ